LGNKVVGDLAGELHIAPELVQKVVLHAVLGGLISKATGGDFSSGAIAGGVAEGLTPIANNYLAQYVSDRFSAADLTEAGSQAKITTAQLIGLIASSMAGGSAATGSLIGGAGEKYNNEQHHNPVEEVEAEIRHSEGLPIPPQEAEDLGMPPIQSIVPGLPAMAPSLLGGKGAFSGIQTWLTSQVGALRSTLSGSAKTSGNMGVADIDIPGVPSSMAASSRIDDPSPEQQALGFVGRVPETFKSSVVPTAGSSPYPLLRDIDSEAKILNNIAAQLKDNVSAAGKINLLTERPPCASCSNVISEFQAKYPNIEVNVFSNGGVIAPAKK
jgi:hypothetical protein